MKEKETRIQKWLEKFNQFMAESKQRIRRINTRRLEKRDKVRWYGFRTQSIRREIARKLGDIYDLAVEYAKDETIDPNERMKWSRVAAFIAQTLNTILKAHDEFEIEKAINELKRWIEDVISRGDSKSDEEDEMDEGD